MANSIIGFCILLQVPFLLTALATPAQAQTAFTADRHQARGLTCAACHGEGVSTAGGSGTSATAEASRTPAAAGFGDEKAISKRCQTCHGNYQAVIDRTKGKYPDVNPHDQHDGDLNCTVCHKGHKKSENYCEECHGTFVFKVP